MRSLIVCLSVASILCGDAFARTFREVPKESSIERRRVAIDRTVRVKPGENLNRDNLSFEQARQFKLEQKTLELIDQIEVLLKRPGQRERQGELKMRLAELYFDRAQGTAAQEAAAWESRVKAWEDLSESERANRPRPSLNTPKADAFRQSALALYRELEKSSRSGDMGASQMIRREDVLFFLSSTLMDLGKRKDAIPLLDELIKKFPKGARTAAARINLADLYFEGNQFAKAVPLYLQVAAAPGGWGKDFSAQVKIYALYRLGWSYMNLSDFDKSVRAFTRTIEESRASGASRRLIFEREAVNDLGRAYALGGFYEQGEAYFKNISSEYAEAQQSFRLEAAMQSRDKGDLPNATRFYGLLISENPKAAVARDYGMEILLLQFKKLSPAESAAALSRFAKDFGRDSSWARSQSETTRQAATDDLVSMMRREAKNRHRLAQDKDQKSLFMNARPFYETYFSSVPSPNADTDANVHEMRFFYAELLYKLGDFSAAATAYAQVGAGKYQSAATLARLNALQELTKGGGDAQAAGDLEKATEDFIQSNASDPRSGDLLYDRANRAFDAQRFDEAVGFLAQVIERFPNEKRGVQSAERTLFIYEKQGKLDELAAAAEKFKNNAALMQAGGDDFSKRLSGISDAALFKKTETLKESSQSELLAKGQAFFDLRGQVQGADLREKALNNAVVFFERAGAVQLATQARGELIAQFPKSKFAKGALLKAADQAVEEGSWRAAMSQYDLALGSKLAFDDEQSAKLNRLSIELRLNDLWEGSFVPGQLVPKPLVDAMSAFVQQYPKSSGRSRFIEILAFRRGAVATDLKRLRALPGLSKDQVQLIAEGELVARIRAGESSDALLRSNPPAADRGPVAKKALATVAMMNAERQFVAFRKLKLDFAPTRFVASLQTKLKQLKVIESQYQKVVAFGDPDFALQALERISQVYLGFAADLEKAPIPPNELKPFVDPLKSTAHGALRNCVEKAAEFRIGGAGLSSCRNAAAREGLDFANITLEVLPNPTWLPPAPAEGLRSTRLMQAALTAAADRRYGAVDLAAAVFFERFSDAPKTERARMQVLKAMADGARGRFALAVSGLLEASQINENSLQLAAVKNLAALYLQIANWGQAEAVLEGVSQRDPEIWHLLALAYKGQGNLEAALDAYEEGVKNAPVELHFNRALSFASSSLFREAVRSMGRYIELSNPPLNSPARELLRTWRSKEDASL